MSTVYCYTIYIQLYITVICAVSICVIYISTCFLTDKCNSSLKSA